MTIPGQSCGDHDGDICEHCGLDHVDTLARFLAALATRGRHDADAEMQVSGTAIGLLVVQLRGSAQRLPNARLGPQAARLARQRRPEVPAMN